MMKKTLLALFLTACSASAYAAIPDYYLGLDLGYSDTNYSDGVLGANSSSTGLGARLFGGYEFTPNFSFELGWTHFAKASGDRVKSVYQSASDLSFVGRLPIGSSGLSGFAKLGMAYVQAEKDFSGQGHIYANKIRPAFGIGVENTFTPNLSMTMQLWHIQGQKGAFNGYNIDSRLPSANLYSVGVLYRFN